MTTMERRLGFRRIFAVLGFCAGLYFAQPGGAAAAPLRVQVMPGNFASLQVYIGASQGFYKKEGLDVELIKIANGPQANSALVSKSVDVIMNMPDNMILLKHRGVDTVAVVGDAVQYPFFLIERKGAGLPAGGAYAPLVKGLKGKTIGVYGLGSSTDRFVRQLGLGAGVLDADLNRVAMGGPAQAVSGLVAGKLDMVVDVLSTGILVEQMGIGQRVLDCSDPVAKCPSSITEGGKTSLAYFTTKDFLAENADTMRKFVRAQQKVDAWMHDPANRGALVAELKKVLPVPTIADPEKYYAAVADRAVSFFGVSVSLKALEAIQQGLLDTGEVPRALPLADMVWAEAPKP